MKTKNAIRKKSGWRFWFAQRGEYIRSGGRSRRHPGQGQDNPNCKGVAGNGGVRRKQ
jgi:hypothetical protein